MALSNHERVGKSLEHHKQLLDVVRLRFALACVAAETASVTKSTNGAGAGTDNSGSFSLTQSTLDSKSNTVMGNYGSGDYTLSGMDSLSSTTVTTGTVMNCLGVRPQTRTSGGVSRAP